MENTGLKDSEAVVLKLTANSLFNANFTIDEADTDWKSVFIESKKQAVCALAFNATETLNLPAEIKENWFNYAVIYYGKNIQVNSYHNFVHELMVKNNIPYCILKGCASEYYYPNQTLRAMGDVDFFVLKDDLQKTTDKFIKVGFESYGHNHDVHIHLKKNDMDFELHFDIPGMPDGEKGNKIRNILKDIIDCSKETKIGDATFMMPSPLHHGIILLLHTYNHLFFEGVGLRHLCDWAVFVNSFTESEFEKLFSESLKKIGLWKFARILSATACKYLNMPYKSWIGEVDDELCKRVILDIFEGGNFGGKTIERAWQGQMIAYKVDPTLEKNNFSRLIAVKNCDAARKFPIFKKYKLLYPFGWVFLGIRYTVNLILGKRPYVNINQLAKGADKRKEIYKQFELFEEEFENV